MRKAPTRVLVVATSLVVLVAAVLAVTASAQSGARANHRARPFHLTKACPSSQYAGQIGGYCTVMSANVAAITVGTKIFYAQAASSTSLDSDIILYAGSGNTATGHCALNFLTGLGHCTLSGGTGTLEGIRASVDVSHLDGDNWAWDGTYRFREDD
jgi:hypothetical protein